VAEHRDAERAVRDVFGVSSPPPSAGSSSGEDSGELVSGASSGVFVQGPAEVPAPVVHVVDANGAPVSRDVLRVGRPPRDVWGAEAALVAAKRIAEARRFREWALQ